jgi:hypothetical protein
MQVKNKEVFHIHRIGEWSDKWKVGATIYWTGEELNFFSRAGDNYDCVTEITNGKGMMDLFEALKIFFDQTQEYKLQNYESILKEAHNRLRQNAIYLREFLFEEVRRDSFVHLPSRRTCVWGCSMTAVEQWFNSMKRQKKILKLSVTGNYHQGDNKHLKIGTFSLDTYRKNARSYWSGVDGSDPANEECIFNGVIDILEEYFDFETFRRQNT